MVSRPRPGFGVASDRLVTGGARVWPRWPMRTAYARLYAPASPELGRAHGPPSPIPGRYLVLAENGLGAKALDHFLRQIAFASDALADHAVAGGVAASAEAGVDR